MSHEPVHSAAGRALEELLEVSPQVDAAVILERTGGRLLASAPAHSDRMADRLGATCLQIVEAAEQARRELGREPIAQVEVGTPDGHVFVVADATWVVAAVTDADPTVGLVFYDLKTALRTVRESNAAGSAPSSSPAAVIVQTDAASTGDDHGDAVAPVDPEAVAAGDPSDPTATATSTGDDAGSGDAPTQSPGQVNPRWRRRKQ